MSDLLLNEPPVLVQPSLVRRLGMVEAAIVQQLHYWSARATIVHEGERYVYKTYQDWSDEIGITSKQARGALDRLRASGVVVGVQNPTDSRDRTLWWRIDHAVLNGGDTDPGARSAPEGSSALGLPPAADRTAPQGSSTRASRSRTETTSETTGRERAPASRLKFNGKALADDVAAPALAALVGWNERTGQTNKPTKASGKLTDAMSRIVGAMLDYPEVRTLWPVMIDRALTRPWWDGEPTTGVVFGGKAVEGAIQQARAPIAAKAGGLAGNVHPIRRGSSWTAADVLAIGAQMEREAQER